MRERLKVVALGASAALASIGLASVSTRQGVWVIASAWGAFAALLFLGPALRWGAARLSAARRALVAELLGPCAVMLAVGLVHPFLLRLDAPTTHDHPIHLAKAVWTWNDLFPFALAGWSDSAETGWPLNVLYPPGASLLPVLIRALTFGLLDWTRAYALALLLGVSVTPLALYALARRPMGRFGATVGALASIPVLGGWFQGGFDFDVSWGVWGTSAAVGLAALATAFLPGVVRGERSAVVGCAVSAAAAVVFHPFALVAGALLGGPRALQLCLVSDDEGAPPAGARGAFWLLAAAGLGASLSAWWWLPFGARAGEYALGLGRPWKGLGALASDLLNGTLFPGTPVLLVAAGLLGLLLGVARRRPVALAGAASFALTLLLASSDLPQELGLLRLMPGLQELQLERFAYVLKVLLWLGCAELGAALAAAGGTAQGGWMRAPVAAFVAVIAAVGVAAWTRAGPILGAPPFRWPQTVSNDARIAHWKAAGQFIRERLDEGPFFRTVLGGTDSADHSALWVPALSGGIPVTRTTAHAAELFRYDWAGVEPRVLRAQDVRYVLTPNSFPDRSDFALVRRFGHLNLYEWAGFRPGQRAHLVDAEGNDVPGEVTVVGFGRREVRVRVSGAPAGAVLLVHRAPWATWEATRDGAPVEPEPFRIAASMRASVVALRGGDGEYVLTDASGGPERLGWTLGWLGAGLGLALLLVRWEPPPWLLARVRGLEPHAPVVASAASVVVLLLWVLRAHGLGIGGLDMLAQLEAAEVRLGSTTCSLEGGGAGFRCGERHWQRPHRVLLEIEGYARRCVWAAPTTGEPLELTWREVRMGRRLLFGHGLGSWPEGNGATPARLTVEVEGLPPTVLAQEDHGFWREARIDTRAVQGQRRWVRVRVSAERDGVFPLCFVGRVE